MSNEWEKQEGVLLHSIPYLGIHRIFKVFTLDEGLLILMAKHVKAKHAAATNPFCRSEWVYRKSRGDIYPIREATLLDPLDELRREYRILIAAGSIANDLLRSQFPHRPAKGLYELLIVSYKHLPRNPLRDCPELPAEITAIRRARPSSHSLYTLRCASRPSVARGMSLSSPRSARKHFI